MPNENPFQAELTHGSASCLIQWNPEDIEAPA